MSWGAVLFSGGLVGGSVVLLVWLAGALYARGGRGRSCCWPEWDCWLLWQFCWEAAGCWGGLGWPGGAGCALSV